MRVVAANWAVDLPVACNDSCHSPACQLLKHDQGEVCDQWRVKVIPEFLSLKVVHVLYANRNRSTACKSYKNNFNQVW